MKKIWNEYLKSSQSSRMLSWFDMRCVVGKTLSFIWYSNKLKTHAHPFRNQTHDICDQSLITAEDLL